MRPSWGSSCKFSVVHAHCIQGTHWRIEIGKSKKGQRLLPNKLRVQHHHPRNSSLSTFIIIIVRWWWMSRLATTTLCIHCTSRVQKEEEEEIFSFIIRHAACLVLFVCFEITNWTWGMWVWGCVCGWSGCHSLESGGTCLSLPCVCRIITPILSWSFLRKWCGCRWAGYPLLGTRYVFLNIDIESKLAYHMR